MSLSFRFYVPNPHSEFSRKLSTSRQIICEASSSPRNPNDSLGEKADDGSEHKSDSRGHDHGVILVERYGNGASKRYLLDDESNLRSYLEENKSEHNGFVSNELSWLPDIVKDLVLPAGFPESVSDDYLEYMLLQFPTNVTAWICHTLVTSSLLKAVGLDSFSGSSAVASAGAIRWVSKDGIGAVGRLFIGGRFGKLFDDDPKQWRMYADFIGSGGSIFDLCTPLYPAYFLPLASLGNLAKAKDLSDVPLNYPSKGDIVLSVGLSYQQAVARGLKDPSFRVIQSHFAISGNLGDVAAKEEVWEVSAQLLGLALGVLVLDTPELLKSYPLLVFVWMSMRLLHLWLRYQSLSVLQFNTINLKRARILVNMHVSESKLPGCRECNRMENILSWERFSKPRIVFGASLDEMIGSERSGYMVKMLLKLYSKEKYLLSVNQKHSGDFEVLVSFKEGATSLAVLRSVWQTYWLYENQNNVDGIMEQLQRSLSELEDRFENFLEQLHEVGWDTNQINLKVNRNDSVEELDLS